MIRMRNKPPATRSILDEQLDSTRNLTIDKILLAVTLLTMGNYILNLLRDAELIRTFTTPLSLTLHLLLRGGLGFILCLIAYAMRHRISYQVKYLMCAVACVQVFLFAISYFGILAPAKVMMIFAPVVVAMAFELRFAIYILILMVVAYLATEWLFMSGQLTFGNPAGISAFILNPATWLAQGILFTGLTIGLLFMGRSQKTSLTDALTALEQANQQLESEEQALKTLRDNLEQLVKDQTLALEEKNRQLMVTNRTLKDRNLAHQLQQSELQHVLEEYREKQSTLLESGKFAAIGLLTAGMAHEVNNPLNFINGASHLIEMETKHTGDPEAFSHSLARIREAVSRTHQLVKGLNQFGRKTDRQDETCDLTGITRNVMSIMNISNSAGLTMDTAFPETPLTITGNAGKLHQAFLNLFQQVIQEMGGSGVLRIKGSSDDREVRLLLSRGIGKEQEPVAGEIQRVSRKDSLRMYIIHRIIREHRGTLMVTIGDDGWKYWEVRFGVI